MYRTYYIAKSTDHIVHTVMDCPVCHTLFIRPRVYSPCGHSVCELCMLKMDMTSVQNVPVGTAPVFKCPVCRGSSFTAWCERPINHSLINVLRDANGASYDDDARKGQVENENFILQNVQNVNEMTVGLPDQIPYSAIGKQHLPSIAYGVRIRKASSVLHDLLPTILRAACNGQCKVVITSRVDEIKGVGYELSAMLFEYGIHSMCVSDTEVVIHILPISDDHHAGAPWTTALYSNPQYEPPHLTTVASDEEEV